MKVPSCAFCLHHPGHPPLSRLGAGSNWTRAPLDPNRRQCFAFEPTSEVASSRRNSASSCIIWYCSITCWRMKPSCWLVSSATVFAIASMTSSASAVSTLSEPACPIPQSWSQEPLHVGGRSELLPGGETVARSAPGAYAAARSCFSVSAADTFTSVHRFKGSIAQDPRRWPSPTVQPSHP